MDRCLNKPEPDLASWPPPWRQPCSPAPLPCVCPGWHWKTWAVPGKTQPSPAAPCRADVAEFAAGADAMEMSLPPAAPLPLAPTQPVPPSNAAYLKWEASPGTSQSERIPTALLFIFSFSLSVSPAFVITGSKARMSQPHQRPH